MPSGTKVLYITIINEHSHQHTHYGLGIPNSNANSYQYWGYWGMPFEMLYPNTGTTKPYSQPPVSQQQNTSHYHRVICGVCSQMVVGPRYKCTICQNFDLCAICEARGNHSEHIMMRLPNGELTKEAKTV